MLQTDFLRCLNTNYERILLDKAPEEKRYQYCMISRGGMKGLLNCSLRYINGDAYLYYDITSKQNVLQLYAKRPMTRQWVKDLIWSIRQIREELSRFLLDETNVLWYPEMIFQDLENNIFSFMYVPYYEEDSGFGKLLEFMVEHINYEDDVLVEFVYKAYEQYESCGDVYLQEKIFEDAECLNQSTQEDKEVPVVEMTEEKQNTVVDVQTQKAAPVAEGDEEEHQDNRWGLRSIFQGRKSKAKERSVEYENTMQLEMAGYAVAEEAAYDEEWGKTIYIEETPCAKEHIFCLYTTEGRLVAQLDKDIVTIGKKKKEADIVLEDLSISRIHARIFKEQGELWLEDLNSTNGTFKNGLRMLPYEKRKLEAGDEIKFGGKELIFR